MLGANITEPDFAGQSALDPAEVCSAANTIAKHETKVRAFIESSYYPSRVLDGCQKNHRAFIGLWRPLLALA